MKNGLLKLVLLLVLALSVVISLASCDSLPFLGKGDDTANSDNSGLDGGTNDTEGKGDGQTPPQHEHLFTDWITTKPATCAEEGELARVCTCGFRDSKPIEKTNDHSYSSGKCTLCGEEDPTGGITDIGKMESFDYSKVPAYSGSEYVTVNGNVPFFTDADKVTESYETYGAFDFLERCTVVMACIGKDLMPTEARKDPTYKPTGWIQAQYSFIGSDALYNRCHLIAWQLTGEANTKENLITGTRYMNEAMIPFENMVAAYIKETSNHVMYRATPIFEGDNLLASGVLLEAYSVEDGGEGICFNVFLYNVQPKVILDYSTGASEAENPEDEAVPECDYIVNMSKTSKKIHTPDCHNANAISEKNKWYYIGNIEDLEADGYTRAGCCNPK